MAVAVSRRQFKTHVGADIDLRSIVDSWQDTLDDEQILQLLRNRNAGLPLFQTIHASTRENDEGRRESD